VGAHLEVPTDKLVKTSFLGGIGHSAERNLKFAEKPRSPWADGPFFGERALCNNTPPMGVPRKRPLYLYIYLTFRRSWRSILRKFVY